MRRHEDIDKAKRSVPITPAKIHDIGDGVKAWVYPDPEEREVFLGIIWKNFSVYRRMRK